MIDFFNINTYFIFFLGLIFGSFLNVVIYRMPRELKISKGRSECCNCGHTLRWYDLIPLFSYLFIGGRCRYCKAKISIQYPLVELTTGVIFTLVYSFIINLNGYFGWAHIILLVISLLVIVGIFTDFLYHGAFDFSTIGVCALLFLYLLIINKSFKQPIILSFQSLSYIAPLILIVIYLYVKQKGKLYLNILTFIAIVALSMYTLINFEFDMYTTIFLRNAIVNWFCLSIPLIIADYILTKKIVKSERTAKIISNLINWVNFVLFFIFMFNTNHSMMSKDTFIAVLSPSLKNLIILVLFTLFYMFLLETFDDHDNNEEIIDSKEDIIDRDENIFTSFIGDADIFILPFAGMLLGYYNLFNFFILLGISVLGVYICVFRKGFKYSIPLYPFIILSIFILFSITPF